MNADIERTISNSKSGKRAAAVRDNRHTTGNAPTETIATSQHTPGPRKIHRHESGEPFLVVTGDEESSTAYVGAGRAQVFHNNAEANARLIAAAPEMLEALRACLSVLPYGNESIDLMARAAIAKATGGK